MEVTKWIKRKTEKLQAVSRKVEVIEPHKWSMSRELMVFENQKAISQTPNMVGAEVSLGS